ncbi:hypothetical protein [Deinococcus wulumuqiensis]|uniref:Uncharacterized protein n=1 Tax=Deinococcus wulumuqiensis TaxID=980427 RepID=A0AAV4KA75_9DEIO|nr:hypothetical protein [Deinococcus wulumuqiensis]QII19542.1 hypothetical protein G6R31_01325 [Deinococcus wulumuqiensis R12]GGI88388.1 hypothetical protein GCM10010914_23500 [Deinococcus wulumuqiensis]GGP30357.1 hypothetical protein GCM10008021_20080 [Deinococcus wulumuqiensis]
MSEEHPFLALSGPNPAGQDAAGAVPDALFDLAVNRAAAAVRGLGRPEALAAWHARTRFARRVALAEIRAALERRPAQGVWHWAGGPGGGWQPGKAAFP